MVVVVDATKWDVPSWLEIVQEVEPLFGPMPDFEAHLRRSVERETAACVRSCCGRIEGGITYRRPPHFEISWLAVRASARGTGVGRALVTEVLRRYGPQVEVTVVTFGEDVVEGLPARRLYRSAGFLPAERLPNGSPQGSRQRFRRPRAPAPTNG